MIFVIKIHLYQYMKRKKIKISRTTYLFIMMEDIILLMFLIIIFYSKIDK